MEQIYTIPVNEAFEASAADHDLGCPFCRLYNKVENQELDAILGGAMMEPAIRIRTNEAGFCDVHFKRLLGHGKRLPLALILESHLDEVLKESPESGLFAAASGGSAIKKLGVIADSCYLCGQIGFHFDNMMETAALLWQKDDGFREKCLAQPYFCLPHYVKFLALAKVRLSGKEFGAFYAAVSKLENAFIETIGDDVSWFCKKFDYRYTNEPWNGCKDAPERAIKFLTGDLHLPEDDPQKKRGETLGS